MPQSIRSLYSTLSSRDDADHNGQSRDTSNNNSPIYPRRYASARTSDADLRSRLPVRQVWDETSRLLAADDGRPAYMRSHSATAPSTPRFRATRKRSFANNVRKAHSRRGSLAARLTKVLDQDSRPSDDAEPSTNEKVAIDDRVWYDQFTSTDWVHDSIADAFRVKELRSRKDFRGRLLALFDAAQGWILVALIGCATAAIAYMIDVTEVSVFDIKTGYCTTGWYHSKRQCCAGVEECAAWSPWSVALTSNNQETQWVDFVVYNFWVISLAVIACLITLRTKTTVSSAISLSTLDENLAAEVVTAAIDNPDEAPPGNVTPVQRLVEAAHRPPIVYYPAAGSGVAEVKVILSGFVLHGYLGLRTIATKSIGLVFSVGSGLSLGKEGPYVHIATCIGNIFCRMFAKYNRNDGKRREVLSAAAASGVAVAFGAPISGVLFSLEEVSYYFPPKTLFRTFFCCIVAALSLKFLDPYGTQKIVLFQVRYTADWHVFEVVIFILLGVIGGVLGALFIKASAFWARNFRRIPQIKQHPVLEVLLVAVITGSLSFWNKYTKLPVAELLYELAAPCQSFSDSGDALCPTAERIPSVIGYLSIAAVIKAFLTTITFGIKVPAGIYVPSMVVGGLVGRIVGHTVQLVVLKYPDFVLFSGFPENGNPESIVVPGIYALTAAGATMCGVTRLSVTLAVILFELTGSLEHVLPFSLAILVSKWTADALEPLSIYDLLTDMNSYPYLDAKARPVFTNDLVDITHPPRRSKLIDISSSPLVPATELRKKLDLMHIAGEVDGGIPIIRDGILVGLIPGPDLEFALDHLGEAEQGALCLMANNQRRELSSPDGASGFETPRNNELHQSSRDEGGRLSIAAAVAKGAPSPHGIRYERIADPTDFTPYVDPAPVTLDICSPMDLVFECFVKLGLRYLCVLREGRFAGLVHKKAFVRYVKEVEEAQRTGHDG